MVYKNYDNRKATQIKVKKFLIMCIIVIGFVFAGIIVKNQNKNTNNSTGDYQNIMCFGEELPHINITTRESAYDAISILFKQLGLPDPRSELGDLSINTAFGENFYRFNQVYNEIIVYGRNLVIETDLEGNVIALVGNYKQIDKVDLIPKVDILSAKKAILQKYKDGIVYLQGLAIYTFSELDTLTWQFVCITNDNLIQCFVSAQNGEMVDSFALEHHSGETANSGSPVRATGFDVDNKKVEFNAFESNDGNYYLIDTNRNICIYNANEHTLRSAFVYEDEEKKLYKFTPESAENFEVKAFEWTSGTGKLYLSVENNVINIRDKDGNLIGNKVKLVGLYLESGRLWGEIEIAQNDSTMWLDKKAATVMSRVSDVYDFYEKILHRNGFDGNASTMYIVYNDLMQFDTKNAYSNRTFSGMGTLLSFGIDCPLTYDIIGHEYTHSVTETICGLQYKCESGAISESLSDIFGEIIEDYYDDGHLNSSCDWKQKPYERNYIIPYENKKPSKYRGKYWYSGDNDDKTVHTNSCVISHAAYLMSTGIENNPLYESLSSKQLAQLFYCSMWKLPSDCTFEQFREIVQATAQIMFLQDIINEKQLHCVSNAFFQVEIPGKEIQIPNKNFQKNNDVQKQTIYLESEIINKYVNLEDDYLGENGSEIETTKYVYEHDINGDVQSYKIYLVDKDFQYKLQYEYYYTYKQDGKIGTIKGYNSKDVLISEEEYIYNEFGELILKIVTTYTDDAKLSSYERIKYDSQERIVSQEAFNSDYLVYSYNEYEYDIDGSYIIRFYDEDIDFESNVFLGIEKNELNYQVRLDDKKEHTVRNEQFYNAQGNLLKSISYNIDGTVQFSLEKIYDNNGNNIKTTTSGDAAFGYEYVYDDKGNLLQEFNYNLDGTNSLYKQYTYDSKGNRLSEEYWFSGVCTSKTINTYNSQGNIIEMCTYDTNNHITKKVKCTYDEEGNLILVSHFNGNEEFAYMTESYFYDRIVVSEKRAIQLLNSREQTHPVYAFVPYNKKDLQTY